LYAYSFFEHFVIVFEVAPRYSNCRRPVGPSGSPAFGSRRISARCPGTGTCNMKRDYLVRGPFLRFRGFGVGRNDRTSQRVRPDHSRSRRVGSRTSLSNRRNKRHRTRTCQAARLRLPCSKGRHGSSSSPGQSSHRCRSKVTSEFSKSAPGKEDGAPRGAPSSLLAFGRTVLRDTTPT
jgi:hypothetical protein